MRVHRPAAAWRPVAQLLLIALAFLLALGVVYYLSVRTVQGRLLGDASLRGALLTRAALTGTVDAVLNVVSIATLLGAVALVAVIALVRLARFQGLAAVVLLLGANGSTWLLKNVLLSRPDLGLREVAPATLNSLPSGHTTAVFSAVAALVFVLPRRWRLTAASIGAVAATLTALATMSAGWHRPADSVAAFLVVGVWTAAAAVAVVLFGTPSPVEEPTPARPRSLRWLAACSAGCLVLGGTLSLLLAAAPAIRDSAVGSSTAFLAGAFLVVGGVTAVLLGVLAALELMDDATART